MGPGIFTTHSKKVLGGCAALLAMILLVMAYYEFRSPVGDKSPYDAIVEQGEQGIEVVADQVFYAAQTDPLQVTVRNNSETGWLEPEVSRPMEWVLEMKVDGVWRSIRTLEKNIDWEFPEADKAPNGGPSGIVKNGEEQVFLCYLGEYYKLPLDPGTYRVVFPDMIKGTEGSGTWHMELAAEFEVLP